MIALAALVAVASLSSPWPTPSPSSSPAPLKEIGSVRSTPYCTSFYAHFNAAVHPMLQNDLTLNQVSGSLDNINALFSKIDWEQQFYDERLRMMNAVAALEHNNFEIQREVNALRQGEKFSNDPMKAKEMHMLAQELQRALDKQKQMATDLGGVVHAMMDYDIAPEKLTGRPIGGFSLEELAMPKDAKNIKSYLRFDGMRDRLHDAEVKAAQHAQAVVESYC